MDKKNIIFAAIGFVSGVAAGVSGMIVAKKVKEKKNPSERKHPLLSRDLPKKEEEKEEATEEVGPKIVGHIDPVEEKKEAEAIIEQEGYGAEYEHPEDDDPEHETYMEQLRMKKAREDYVNAHKGKIELMTEEEWDTDFPEEDYSHAELWYFPDEDVLTDEDGNIVEPIEEYVGELFDKVRFKTNDWERIYVRNHPRGEDYYIHKETRMSREDFFY